MGFQDVLQRPSRRRGSGHQAPRDGCRWSGARGRRNRLRSIDSGCGRGDVATRPVSCPWHWRSCGRSYGGICERRVFPGVGIRRHAQRVDRSHEQSGGCRGSGRGGAWTSLRTGSDCSHCGRQRDLLSGGQRRTGSVSSTGLPSDRAFCDFWCVVPCQQALALERECDGQCRRHLRQLCGRSAGMLGRWNTDEIPASRMGSAERDIRRVSRPRRGDRSGACFRRTLWSVRLASSGSGDAARPGANHRRARDEVGKPALVVQAFPRCARSSSVYRRAAALEEDSHH